MDATTEIDDGLISSASDMAVKLDVFEGPLDLLLFLIRKNEIDIYDIPIAEVTSQYMGVLRSMEKLSLDVAGEFFVMAATLMYIKSRMLLPSDERAAAAEGEEDDSDIDPRWELVEQLLEYKKVKQAADALEDMIDARSNFGERVLSGKDDMPAERPLQPSDKMEMWNTFNLILRRLAEKLVRGEIKGENVTVSDRMEFILEFPEKNFTFTSLFEGEKVGVVKIMATFLAMLELTRLKRLRLRQDAEFGEIYCEKLDEAKRPAESARRNSAELDAARQPAEGEDGEDAADNAQSGDSATNAATGGVADGNAGGETRQLSEDFGNEE